MIFMSAFYLDQQRHTYHAPFIRTIVSWGLREALLEGQFLGRKIQVKQALGWAGMYAENPEDSYVEWPDHTPHLYIPSMTYTLVHPLSQYPWGQVYRGHCNQIQQHNTDSSRQKILGVRDLACSEKSFIARMCRPTFEPSTH